MKSILRKMMLPAAALSLSLPLVASAHDVAGGSVTNALSHLFLNLDHLIAVASLVILGRQLSQNPFGKKPVVLVSSMVLGGILAFMSPILLIGVCSFSSIFILYQSRSWKAEK